MCCRLSPWINNARRFLTRFAVTPTSFDLWAMRVSLLILRLNLTDCSSGQTRKDYRSYSVHMSMSCRPVQLRRLYVGWSEAVEISSNFQRFRLGLLSILAFTQVHCT